MAARNNKASTFRGTSERKGSRNRASNRASGGSSHSRAGGNGRKQNGAPEIGRTLQETAHTLSAGREWVAETPRLVRRAGDGLREVGAATIHTARRYPVASSMIGAGIAAGLTALAVRAFREPSLGAPMSLKERQRRAREAERRGLLEKAGHALESTRAGVGDALEAVREGAVELGSASPAI